jgi:hypothetical protein
MKGFHDFSMGLHCTHMKRALSPMPMFIEMIMNHTTNLSHPCVNRSSVRAKLVLDHMAAVREKVPHRLMTLSKSGNDAASSGG